MLFLLKKEKQQTYNEQLESIDLVYDIVKDLKDTHTLFVGGEIFAETDKLIKEKLLNLYDLTFKRMLDGYLDLCYFNTNILYKLDNLTIYEFPKEYAKKEFYIVNNQTSSIKFENLKNICDILECTPNDLFEEYHQKNSN